MGKENSIKESSIEESLHCPEHNKKFSSNDLIIDREFERCPHCLAIFDRRSREIYDKYQEELKRRREQEITNEIIQKRRIRGLSAIIGAIFAMVSLFFMLNGIILVAVSGSSFATIFIAIALTYHKIVLELGQIIKVEFQT